MARATGRLTRKTSRQLALTSRPPSGGPAAAATPPTAAQMPIAVGRRWGSNSGSSSASEVGIRNAAPIAWITRAATSVGAEGAAPQRSDPSAKTISPPMKARRRPKRSASAPAGTSSAANTIA